MPTEKVHFTGPTFFGSRTGIGLIAYERTRQVIVEGFTPSKDQQYRKHELLKAALCYVAGSCLPLSSMKWIMKWWPFGMEWWKPTHDTKRNLAKAGALIAAHLDVLLTTEPAGAPMPTALPSKECPVHLPKLAMDICEQNLHIVVGRAVGAHGEAMVLFEKAQDQLDRARNITQQAYELMVFLKSCGSVEATVQFEKMRHQISHLCCEGVKQVGVKEPMPADPKQKRKPYNEETEEDPNLPVL